MIDVREGRETDYPFIFATWLRSYKRSSYFASHIDPGTFFANHHQVIENILHRSATRVFVATPQDDHDTIVGYLVGERGHDFRQVIHFIYVKKSFRRMGVMTELLTKSGVDPDTMVFTHWTFDMDKLAQEWPGAVYDPYRSWRNDDRHRGATNDTR